MSYYLSKSGTKFGPFNDAQLNELKSKGEYLNYSFFWDDAQPGWQPIDTPPATPGEDHSVAKSKAPARDRESRYYQTKIQAVCLNHDHAITCQLAKVNDEGCDLIADGHGAAPQFVANARATLNLFDEKSGKSVNVPVQIAKISRQGGSWKYRIHWEICPELIANAA
jgi:hypothetical protein